MNGRRRFQAYAAAPFAAALWVLALLLAAWVVGHTAAYALSDLAHRGHDEAPAAHAYMTPLTASVLAAALLALLVFAAAVRALPRRGGFWSRPLSPPALAGFALVPSLGYLGVELVEHVRVGELPALSTLLLGLLLQLPLGPLAAVVARRLLRAVERLLGPCSTSRGYGRVEPPSLARGFEPLRARPLRGAVAGRAPPAAA